MTITKVEDSENEYTVTDIFTAPNMGVTTTSYTATYSEPVLTVHLDTGDIDLIVDANQINYTNSDVSGYPQVHSWNFYTNSFNATRR